MLGKAGERRYYRAFSYILQYGTLPKPIILLEDGDSHHLVYGNHRFLALRSVMKLHEEISWIVQVSSIHKVWLAKSRAQDL